MLPRDSRGTAPAGLTGVNGGRVRALPLASFVAWVSDVGPMAATSMPGVRGELAYGAVRAHDAVVDAALQTGATPIPARFGQRFVDDAACIDAIERRAAALGALLESLQGLVEMTLLIAPSTRRMLADLEPVIPEMLEPDQPGAGRRYLEKLRAREASTGAVGRATDELAVRLSSASSAFVRSENVHQTVTPMPLRTISHLIVRDDVDDYRRAVGAVERGREFQVLMIGPRAPYSFCALESGTPGNHGINLAD
jgi:hypothetical protein